MTHQELCRKVSILGNRLQRLATLEFRGRKPTGTARRLRAEADIIIAEIIAEGECCLVRHQITTIKAADGQTHLIENITTQCGRNSIQALLVFETIVEGKRICRGLLQAKVLVGCCCTTIPVREGLFVLAREPETKSIKLPFACCLN